MYSTILESIQLPAIIITRKMQTSFGTNVRVCSCMDVTVCNILMTSPTISDTSNIGAETLMIRYSVSLSKVTTISSVKPSTSFLFQYICRITFIIQPSGASVECLYHLTYDKVPTVSHYKEQDLKRHRYRGGRQHHHTH